MTYLALKRKQRQNVNCKFFIKHFRKTWLFSVYFQFALGQPFIFLHLNKEAAPLNRDSFLFSMNTFGNYPVLKSINTHKCRAFLSNRECWISSKSLVGWNLLLQGVRKVSGFLVRWEWCYTEKAYLKSDALVAIIIMFLKYSKEMLLLVRFVSHMPVCHLSVT